MKEECSTRLLGKRPHTRRKEHRVAAPNIAFGKVEQNLVGAANGKILRAQQPVRRTCFDSVSMAI